MDNKSIKPVIGTPYLSDSGHGKRTAKALGKQEALRRGHFLQPALKEKSLDD